MMLSLHPVQAMILTVLTVLLICTDAKKLGVGSRGLDLTENDDV